MASRSQQSSAKVTRTSRHLSPRSPKRVETGLGAYKLDGSVIIAKAIQDSSYELELIENWLAALEIRRDKMLVRIAQYRSDLGAILRKATHQLIESTVVELPRTTGKQKTRPRQRASGQVVELDGAAKKNKDSAA
jgi:hypothetical protein